MSAHDIRSLINLLEAIEQGQKPALPKVVAVPQDQLDQLASALSQSAKLLSKKDLDEAGWRNKLAGAALAAAALGGAGSADALTWKKNPYQDASDKQAQVIKQAEQEKSKQQIQNIQKSQAQQQALSNVPLNTLRDCVATLTASTERMRQLGIASNDPALANAIWGAEKFRQALMNAVSSSAPQGLAGTAINMEMDLLRNQVATYRMMSNEMLVDKSRQCVKILQSTGR